MKNKNFEHLDKVPSANRVIEHIQSNGLLKTANTLKFITLSVGEFDEEDLDWALEFTNRCFNNFFERKFIKKSIRQAIRIEKSINSQIYSKIGINKSLWRYYDKKVKDIIPGGWRKIEIDPILGKPGKFNVHIHIFCENSFIPHSLLSEVWKDVLSKEFKGKKVNPPGIVHVKNVQNTDLDIAKLTNYMAKPVEYLRTERFKNVRLFATFGTWYSKN